MTSVRRNESRWVWSSLAATAVVIAAARGSAAESVAKITYDEHVLPILKEKCSLCHSPEKQRGGLTLTTYPRLMEGGSSGAVIEPGDPEASTLFLLAAHRKEPHMPPKSDKIPEESLETIRKWIAGGALENAGSKPKPTKPKADIALSAAPTQRPEGPAALPVGLSLEPEVRAPRATAVTALASSPWAPVVAVGGQKQVLLYGSDSFEIIGVLPFPEGVPQVLKFSRNGALLLAGGGHGAKSGRVVIWKVTTGERVVEAGEELDQVLAADVSADQSRVALGGPGKVVRVYATADGRLEYELKKHTDWINAVEFSPDGVLLATADRSGNMFVWEAQTGREYSVLRGHDGAITDVTWRSDSNVLASSSEDTTIRLWEMENGGQIKRWGAHGGGVESVEFTHDGRLASAGRDRVVKIWDQNGGMVRQFDPFGDIALRAVFSHDGKKVVAGDWLGEVRVWDVGDGKRLGSLSPNPPSIAERIDAAKKELEAATGEHASLAAAQAASQAASDKGAADLAAARKLTADGAGAAAAAGEKATRAKESAEKAKAALPPAVADLAAREAAVKTASDAARKETEAANEAPGNAELETPAARSKEALEKALGDLGTSQKAATELAAGVEKVVAEWVGAQREGEKAAADSAAGAKAVAALEPLVKAAGEKAAADKAALDQAAARLGAAQAAVEKWTGEARFSEVRKELTARAAEHARIAAAALESASAAEKAAADLAAAEKAGAESQKAAEEAAQGLARAKEVSEKAVGALAGALSELAKKEVDAKGKDSVDKALAELAAAQKSSTELAASLKGAVDGWVGAQQNFAKANAERIESAARARSIASGIGALREKAAADKAALEKAAAALGESRASFDKLLATRR